MDNKNETENQSDEWKPGTALTIDTSTIELTISCRDLQNKDLLSKSDPMVVVYHKAMGSSNFVELNRTEIIEDDLNPDFVQKPQIGYHFEERQPLRFEVYDVDMPSFDLSKHDFLGYMECTLAEIISSGPEGFQANLTPGYYSTPSRATSGYESIRSGAASRRASSVRILNEIYSSLDIYDSKPAGTIILIGEELETLKEEVMIKIAGKSIGNLICCIFPPKIYYEIYRQTAADNFLILYRSDGIRGSTSTNWPPSTLNMQTLCLGDRDITIKIQFYQTQFNKGAIPVGYHLTSLNKMCQWMFREFPLLSNKDNSEMKSSIQFQLCKIQPCYTFLDYVQAGTQIQCIFSIDFTQSNGPPRESKSLHHYTPNKPNVYEQAIHAAGLVLQDYDTDKLFPVYGFGAKIPPNWEISHNFFVTLSESGVCYGVNGVVEAYRSCVQRVQLFGPTNFSPVINQISDLAERYKNGSSYFILMIITDGNITDMDKTKESIVRASKLPISIIIVGVGVDEFDMMEELDGDSCRISYKGKFAERDIVQFVPYRDATTWLLSTVSKNVRERLKIESPLLFRQKKVIDTNFVPSNEKDKEKEYNDDKTYKLAQEKLAKEVLAEIPDQLLNYMKKRSILPGTFLADESEAGWARRKKGFHAPVPEITITSPLE